MATQEAELLDGPTTGIWVEERVKEGKNTNNEDGDRAYVQNIRKGMQKRFKGKEVDQKEHDPTQQDEAANCKMVRPQK